MMPFGLGRKCSLGELTPSLFGAIAKGARSLPETLRCVQVNLCQIESTECITYTPPSVIVSDEAVGPLAIVRWQTEKQSGKRDSMSQQEGMIGFIGAGQMARALAGGMVAAGRMEARQICCADPSPQARAAFLSSLEGAQAIESNTELAAKCQLVFLAIKPQVMPLVLPSLQSHLSEDALVVSVMAGVPLRRLTDLLATKKVIRVMPNTPALIRQGACGVARQQEVSDEELQRVVGLLESVGVCHEVPEHLIDVVTGLSGSGPAYVFLMLEALIDGAVRKGLPRDIAKSLATATVQGTSAMVAESDQHPAELRDRVVSPGGTTAAGLYELEEAGVRAALQRAVAAAADRAAELGAGE